MYEMKEYFDTSNYGDFRTDAFKRDYRYYLHSNERKGVPGLFKDECKGKIIKEFIGLRSKMYSVDIHDDKRKMATAGVKTVKDAGETKFMLAMNSRENLAWSCYGTVTNVANGHVDFKVVTKLKV